MNRFVGCCAFKVCTPRLESFCIPSASRSLHLLPIGCKYLHGLRRERLCEIARLLWRSNTDDLIEHCRISECHAVEDYLILVHKNAKLRIELGMLDPYAYKVNTLFQFIGELRLVEVRISAVLWLSEIWTDYAR